MARTTNKNKVRELQRTLYRAAKAEPGRRFHALYDKVHRRDVLERAWGLVRANRGAAGIARKTIAEVEQYWVDRLPDELAADLSGCLCVASGLRPRLSEHDPHNMHTWSLIDRVSTEVVLSGE
jgi:hypothetical protein